MPKHSVTSIWSTETAQNAVIVKILCFLTTTYLIVHQLQNKVTFQTKKCSGSVPLVLGVDNSEFLLPSEENTIQTMQCGVSAGAQPLSHSPMATSGPSCRNHSLPQAGSKPGLDLSSPASAKLLCKGLSCQVLLKPD